VIDDDARTRRRRRARREVRLLLKSVSGVMIVYLPLGVGTLVADRTVTMAFVESTAQVIPVLMLVLALESRIFRPDPAARMSGRA
jgi:hypothetical protein